ncbi:hypothetical protein ACHAW5_006130 [Stephanodiscus triporus]|uniref:Uncharacterized protein n=1 Tax=Stephanodiscus triporus TaxID=2934178 RepID=A0ABD3MIU3_9STRA
MKGIQSAVTLALLCTASLPLHAASFSPASLGRSMTATATATATAAKKKKIELPINAVVPSDRASTRTKALAALAAIARDRADGSGGDDDDDDDAPEIKINPPYAIAYVLFLACAFLGSSSEPDGASAEILKRFLADPLNPGVNELFVAVFNLLGLYFVPMACLLMPGARRQKLPATPFLLGSMFGGYGALGVYAATRTPDPSRASRADLGWFTSNVLESRAFNCLVALAFASAYVTSGALAALVSDPTGTIGGYRELTDAAIVSVSSLDFAILTVSAASFIPEDLSRRGYGGGMAPELIAASTVLLPGLGVALYCALRPGLDEE